VRRKLPVVLGLLLCLVPPLTLVACAGKPPDVPAARALFIGNSFTEINGGVPAQLQGLAPSLRTDAVLVGGATLLTHWSGGTALTKIRTGAWTYVVLQEQSQTAVTGEQGFDQSVRSFAAQIEAAGATPVLLMTWERPDSVQYGVTTENLAASYERIGREVGARVAPAGLAFARALKERPDLRLNQSDGHPTPAGTYLAACVLYGTLYGRSPASNPFGDLPDDQKQFLQQVAAETLGL
jgi:hypothetical protein